MPKRFHYGGQAVLEGVMMRGPKLIKTAVRRPDGEIVSKTEPLHRIYAGRLRNVPMIRGIIALIETMALGVKALMYSANVAVEAELEEKPQPAIIWTPVIFGIAFGIGLFVVLPMVITHYGVDRVVDSPIVSNLADGLIRAVIFVLYLLTMSMIPDIRRVFAYHGAEHKTVNAYEAGVPLEVSAIQSHSTAHTRCGTAFLMIVLVMAIIIFAFTGQPAIWLRILSRLALLPLIASVSYEFIHFAADHTENIFVRTILRPGLLLQSLTTRQPDDSQVEVAIEALKDVLEPEPADRTGAAPS